MHRDMSTESKMLRRQAIALATVLIYSVQIISCWSGPGSDTSLSGRRGVGSAALEDGAPLEVPADTIVDSAPAGIAATGATPFDVDVTADGASSVKIPLWVSPGRVGVQPNLAIEYNSRAGDGLLGVGFSLSGLSQITRCPLNYAQDGRVEGVDYDTPISTERARYCLDGQRLVLSNATADQHYNEQGTEYRTEKDTYAKIVLTARDPGQYPVEPLTFQAHTQDGRILTFGRLVDRTDSQGNAVDQDNGIFEGDFQRQAVAGTEIVSNSHRRARIAWALTRVQDQAGNRLDIIYEESAPNDTAGAWFRPKRIEYTGFADVSGTLTAPALRSVEFTYESRGDAFTGYAGGVRFTRPFRLSRVDMKGPPTTGGSSGPELLRTYHLRYAGTNALSISKRSLLTELQECDGRGSCRQPLRFDWEKGSWQFHELAQNVSDAADDVGVHTWGLGAGRQGLAYYTHTTEDKRTCDALFFECFVEFTDYVRVLSLPNGAAGGFSSSTVGAKAVWDTSAPGADMCGQLGRSGLKPQIVDWNFWNSYSYGTSDVAALSCSSPAPATFLYLRFKEEAGKLEEAGYFILGVASRKTYWLDMNADHQSEFVWIGKLGPTSPVQLGVSLNGKADFKFAQAQAPAFDTESLFGHHAVDLLGDGRRSLVGAVLGDAETTAFLHAANAPQSADYPPSILKTTIRPPSWGKNLTLYRDYKPSFFFMDVNGDGLQDAVSLGWDIDHSVLPQMDVQLNTGAGFLERTTKYFASNLLPYFRDNQDTSDAVRSGDFDGDGRDDLLLTKPGHPVLILLAGSSQWTQYSTAINSPVATGDAMDWSQVVDVNGDGLLDITRRNGNTLFVSMRTHKTDVLTRVHSGTQLPDEEGNTGLGYSFEYEPLSNPAVYQTSVNESFTTRRVSESMLVVSRMALNVNGVLQRSWRYQYEDGRYSTRGRGWLGFGKRTATDEQRQAVKTTKFQTEYGTGSARGQPSG
ncbi:FG-GAP-like repeat-containing protein [Archangium lansingense]|uniref:FG-GAP-like repeat-containing protein n=1 Tax=Archangium lansingense TaxID=2995310 RepID=UPI003B7BD115